MEYTRSIAIVLVLTSCAWATQVQQCPGQPSPRFVNVEGCEEEPCILYNGGSANMNITFDVLFNSVSLEPIVRAAVSGNFFIPWPVPPPLRDGCKYLANGYCPLEKGEILIYMFSLPLNFPAIPVTLEFSLRGDDQKVLQCFRVAVIVRNPEKSSPVL